MRLELVARTVADTQSIGAALAPLLRAGDAIALTGELGAGKTTMVHGIVRALGFEGAIASPTFTLVREYRTPTLLVLHADVYRLDRVREVSDLGLDEVGDDAVVLVEWGDVVESFLPEDHLVVELTVPGDGDERAISIRPTGRRWALRWERLEQAVEAWRAAA